MIPPLFTDKKPDPKVSMSVRCPNCYALPGDRHAWGCPHEWPETFEEHLDQLFKVSMKMYQIEYQMSEEHF